MRRGEIRWYTFAAPDKHRPVLLLTRDEVIDALNEIIAAPATRTIRGLSTEVLLSPDDGMPASCASGLRRTPSIQGLPLRRGPLLAVARSGVLAVAA
jgi:mRNA interferase MazF